MPYTVVTHQKSAPMPLTYDLRLYAVKTCHALLSDTWKTQYVVFDLYNLFVFFNKACHNLSYRLSGLLRMKDGYNDHFISIYQIVNNIWV